MELISLQQRNTCKPSILLTSFGDPGFLSRIRIFSIPDPHQKTYVFQPKKWFLSSRKNDPGLFIPDSNPDFIPIPDAGVKKAPDPGSGSATLRYKMVVGRS